MTAHAGARSPRSPSPRAIERTVERRGETIGSREESRTVGASWYLSRVRAMEAAASTAAGGVACARLSTKRSTSAASVKRTRVSSTTESSIGAARGRRGVGGKRERRSRVGRETTWDTSREK
eukprot:scaffold67005_cov28-Tisochrysis_lutea.AAC.2